MSETGNILRNGLALGARFVNRELVKGLSETCSFPRVHPSNFVIDTGKTEYIPVGMLHSGFFNIDIFNGRIITETRLPLSWKIGSGSIYRTFARHTNSLDSSRSKLYVDRNTYGGVNYYFNNGFIMDDNNVFFCVAVKTQAIKQQFIEVGSQLGEGRFYQLVDEKGLQNHDEVQDIIGQRLSDKLLRNLNYESLAEDIVIYINEPKLKQLCEQMGASYSDRFNSDNWRSFRIIEESASDWINSKLFCTPEMPTFANIEGPERFTIETLQQADSNRHEGSDSNSSDGWYTSSRMSDYYVGHDEAVSDEPNENYVSV